MTTKDLRNAISNQCGFTSGVETPGAVADNATTETGEICSQCGQFKSSDTHKVQCGFTPNKAEQGEMISVFRAWLWPDHVIGKRESSRLREEHNDLLNAYNTYVRLSESNTL